MGVFKITLKVSGHNKLKLIQVILTVFLLFLTFPVFSKAETNFVENDEPWERVLLKNGSWETQYAKYDGRTFLLVEYSGKRTPLNIDNFSSLPAVKMSLKSTSMLKKIYIPLMQTSDYRKDLQSKQPAASAARSVKVSISLKDSEGKFYRSFDVKEVNVTKKSLEEYPVYLDALWFSEEDIILPAGDYELIIKSNIPLVTGDKAETVPAVLLTGVDYAAKRAHEEKKEIISLLLKKIKDASRSGIVQNDGMQQQVADKNESRSNLQLEEGDKQKPKTNQGSFNLQEDDLQSANGALEKPRFNFTGTYSINLNAVKSSTLMGSTFNSKPDFSLQDYELTILDQGSHLQIIGRYEQIPFSLTAEIAESKENKLKAIIKGSTWLGPISENIKRLNQSLPGSFRVRLPEPAQVSATINIVLEKPPGLAPLFSATGNGTYFRPYVSGKGMDFNTYNISAKGQMLRRELPAFVMAAISQRLGTAGNIPGPDTPFQAATGMLFPPFVSVFAQIVESYYRRRVEEANAAFEELKSKNPEAAALLVWAEAVPDPDSIKENNVFDTAIEDINESYTEQTEENYEVGKEEKEIQEDYGFNEILFSDLGTKLFISEYDRLIAERDEWLHNLELFKESADLSDPQAKELLQDYDRYISYLNQRIDEINTMSANTNTLVLTIDHTGRTAEIVYNPETGQWYNSETGNIFDMERYEKDVLPNIEKDRDFIETQRYKLETGNTVFDREMDKLVSDQKERSRLLEQLQKIRNRAYGIEPPAPGVGDVNANIDRLIDDLSNIKISTENLRDRASRIARVVTDRFTGRTISEEEGSRLVKGVEPLSKRDGSFLSGIKADLQDFWNDVTNINIIADTSLQSSLDIVTGRTWAGMAGRMTLAALTGGYSEIPLSVGEAMYDIKESIEAGEDEVKATLKAVGKYTLGELAGACGEEFLKHFELKLSPKAMEYMSKKLNTPVGELLWQKQTKEMVEGTAKKAYKGMVDPAESLCRKTSDALDYIRYRAEVKDTAEMIAGKIKTGSELDVDDIRRVLRDPSVTRELKNAPEDIKRAYQNALEKNLYEPAINNTKSKLNEILNSRSSFKTELEKQYGPGTKVEVEIISIRTPGTSAEGIRLNADNDLSARIKITDANGQPVVDNKGNPVVRELKLKEVANVYNENFARALDMLDESGKFNIEKAQAQIPDVNWHQLTREQQLEVFAKRHNQQVTLPGIYHEEFAKASGMLDESGKFNIEKAQAEMPDVNWHQLTREQQLEVFAKRHNQEVTDVFSPEAAVDFSKWAEHPLRKNLPAGESAVDLLKAGTPSARLMDPQGLSMMETYKIQEFFNRGGLANQTEAFEQLAKMGKLTNQLTEAFRKLGLPVEDVPENMLKAMEIVSNRNLSPQARILGLKQLGFEDPIDLANKLAGRIEGLQKLSTKLISEVAHNAQVKTSKQALQAVIAAVIRSHLNEK
ncbi:hypothetical protein Calow_2190 [Caldicellulosiruptor owensensis OL]|uniref:Uncharacterized protein n=1 Tax=Caldicellulosiruptor owensensis (strain ATCC 700167 / DSM 13100 / OL) TaxID=632518 RepID=E4Q716_CALOW|nr:hypothetical protein [Caldicellulosiruptor owensensis]ADQ05696.1 hypothetical protein Calow_2190 [Caldicellulosiruptor owensensis OL]